jgi:hypothetical protein
MRLLAPIVVATAVVALPLVALGQLRNDELYRSIMEGRDDALRAYLESGGAPTISLFVPESEATLSLLELAVRSGNDDAAAQLLDIGAHPAVGLGVFSAGDMIRAAASKGMTRTLGVLIDQDPVRLTSIGVDDHPLLYAVGHGHVETTSVILERMGGLSVTAADDILNEALIIATSGDSPSATEIANALLMAGADPVSTPALPGAVINCSSDMVSIFLQAGGDPNQQYGGRAIADYALDCFDSASQARARIILEQLRDGGTDLCALDLTDREATISAAVREIGQCE